MLLPGSSTPSAFILWIMRELPPLKAAILQEASTITFIADSSAVIDHPHRWTTSTSLQNQVCTAFLMVHS
jgi:hypothetical protein